MIYGEQVYVRACLLAGELDEKQRELLKAFSGGAARSLAARLREGVTVESCREAFLTAASFYALAALEEAGGEMGIQEFRAGDLTVKQGTSAGDSRVRRLERQAEALMKPYVQDCFTFMGV